jgi:hypothetical protein
MEDINGVDRQGRRKEESPAIKFRNGRSVLETVFQPWLSRSAHGNDNTTAASRIWSLASPSQVMMDAHVPFKPRMEVEAW